ncbi:MAG: Gfo/Idh/MocA family protein [Candidatus Hydrogenedentota bacterium]
MDRVNVGIVGCGNISDIYFKAGKRFDNLNIVACADLDVERCRDKAEEHGVPAACTTAELLADDTIEIVVNLTEPGAHYAVSMAAVAAGKHVHSEKPLALTRHQGREILDCAEAKGVRVGCAPDTFLGAAQQTARKAIDDGCIGEPVAATAFMQCHGHESWHPNPAFYYQAGGGPLFDMGPYYLTALINLIGPVRGVSGSARITFPERVATCKEREGEVIPVETPTHIAGTLDFTNGAIGTMVTSFDVWRASLHFIEVHGTEGSMQVPDPNNFGGVVRIWRPGNEDWQELPYTHPYADNSRGLAVAELAAAIREDRPHRASGDLAYHVLDIMQGFLDAAATGRRMELSTAATRPAPFPAGLAEGAVE